MIHDTWLARLLFCLLPKKFRRVIFTQSRDVSLRVTKLTTPKKQVWQLWKAVSFNKLGRPGQFSHYLWRHRGWIFVSCLLINEVLYLPSSHGRVNGSSCSHTSSPLWSSSPRTTWSAPAAPPSSMTCDVTKTFQSSKVVAGFDGRFGAKYAFEFTWSSVPIVS